MNNTICPRCAFSHCGMHELNTEIEGWEGEALPPLPLEAHPHPEGICCSPYTVGQQLWWNIDNIEPDMPPIRVLFKELIEIESPQFKLEDNKWIQEGDRIATIARVRLVPESVQYCHEPLFRDVLDQDFEVAIDHLTALTRWPVLVIA